MYGNTKNIIWHSQKTVIKSGIIYKAHNSKMMSKNQPNEIPKDLVNQ